MIIHRIRSFAFSVLLVAVGIPTVSFAQIPGGGPIDDPIEEPIALPGPKDLPPEQPVAAPTVQKYWRFGATAFYNGASSMKFNEAKAAGADFKALYEMEAASALGLEAAYWGPNAWCIQFGLQFEQARKVKSVEATQSTGSRFTRFNPQPDMNVSTGYMNLVYRWDNFYVPFGFTVSGFRFKGGGAVLENIKAGSGYQAGAGWAFNEHLSVEAIYRITTAYGTKSTADYFGTPAETELGVGVFQGLQIGVKAHY